MKKLIILTLLLLAVPVVGNAQGVEASKIRKTTFAKLGTPTNGQTRRCTNCGITAVTGVCATGGTGAWAYADGSAWTCSTHAPAGGLGTVTSVSGVAANGFTWSIATATTTPALTLSYTGSGLPYDLATQVDGKPAVSAVVLKFVAIRSFTLSASGHQCSAGTGANAQTDFIVAVAGVTKATLRFAAAGTTCSIVSGTSASVTAGQLVTITAPGSQDSALADIAFSLSGALP